MRKITVLGANSYIARNIIHLLKKNPREYTMKLYDHAETHADGADCYERVDVLSLDSMSRVNLDCDAVFLFVGKTGTLDGFNNYNTFIDINERVLLNLLTCYRNQTNARPKIIFPSTRLVYKGKAGLLQETAEKEFKTVYAITKYACEQYLEQYARMYRVSYCIFRICVPYGTLVPFAASYGTAEMMMNKAVNGEPITLYGDGSPRRTLTHIGDLCKILVEGAFSANCQNGIFNIGGEDYSLIEMANLISKQYGVPVECAPWPEDALKIESGDTVFDDSKLKAALGNIQYFVSFKTWCKKGNQ